MREREQLFSNESWGPLFAGMEAVGEPQTGALPPVTIEAAVTPPEALQVPCEPSAVEVPNVSTHRKIDALADTFWCLAEVVPGGILLRDGAEGHWYEESLWVPGSDLGRSYAIVYEGHEYEFHSRLRLRNEKRKVYDDSEAQQSPAEAA